MKQIEAYGHKMDVYGELEYSVTYRIKNSRIKFIKMLIFSNVKCLRMKEWKIFWYFDTETVENFANAYELKLKKNSQAVSKSPYRFPIKLKDNVLIELDRLEKIGVIKKCTEPTEWAHRLVILENPSKKLRLCLDPKDLNDTIVQKYYSIPTLNYLCSKLNYTLVWIHRSFPKI